MPPKYSDLESGEQIPALGTNNVSKQTKAILKNAKNPKNLKAKLNRNNNEKCWICMMISCIIICLGISGLIIYLIANFYKDALEERKIIDKKIDPIILDL